MESINVSFGSHKATEKKTDGVAVFHNAVATGLNKAGLPGPFVIDFSKVGIPGMTGQLSCRPIISKKNGRVMYNMSATQGAPIIISGVKLSVSGNLMLPKEDFTVDSEVHTAYLLAREEKDLLRQARAAKQNPTDEDLEAGEHV